MKNQYRSRPSREVLEDDDYGDSSGRDNLFGWTIFLLALTGLALLCWLGSFYVFGHPEKPFSYRLLQKLNKLEAPKQFETTAAPSGEFLSPEELYERFQGKTNAELRRVNDELKRNFINNYQHITELVPYLVGDFEILNSYELSEEDVITSGYISVSQAKDFSQVLVEHIFPTAQTETALLRGALGPGNQMPIQRTFDLHALLHVDRLGDGRMQFTVIPLDYQGRSAADGYGTIMMRPPSELNIEAGWPIVGEERRQLAEQAYESFLTRTAGQPAGERPGTHLVRVAQAVTTGRTPPPEPTPTPEPEATEAPRLPAPIPEMPPEDGPSEEETVERVEFEETVEEEPVEEEIVETEMDESVEVARGVPVDPESDVPLQPFLEAATPTPTPAVTSTGGGWPTYAPGRMPRGRLLSVRDLPNYTGGAAERERLYLGGAFTVTAAGDNRAILRSTDRGGVVGRGGAGTTRIIVDYPAGQRPPAEGHTMNRDGNRPLEITDIRRSEDGLLNVYVREIISP